MSDDYELVEPFDIADGEFDGLAADHIFSLGVEFEMVRRELDAGREIARTVHVENCDRFKAMCFRRGRDASFSPVEGMEDQWAVMNVEAM